MVNRIFPVDGETANARRSISGVRWYHIVIMVLLFLMLVNVQFDRANIRENARLIEQLQLKRVVDDLAEHKKGGK